MYSTSFSKGETLVSGEWPIMMHGCLSDSNPSMINHNCQIKMWTSAFNSVVIKIVWAFLLLGILQYSLFSHPPSLSGLGSLAVCWASLQRHGPDGWLRFGINSLWRPRRTLLHIFINIAQGYGRRIASKELTTLILIINKIFRHFLYDFSNLNSFIF